MLKVCNMLQKREAYRWRRSRMGSQDARRHNGAYPLGFVSCAHPCMSESGAAHFHERFWETTLIQEIKIDTMYAPFYLLANTKLELREIPFHIQAEIDDMFEKDRRHTKKGLFVFVYSRHAQQKWMKIPRACENPHLCDMLWFSCDKIGQDGIQDIKQLALMRKNQQARRDAW